MHAPRSARRTTARRLGIGVTALALAAAGPISSATAHPTTPKRQPTSAVAAKTASKAGGCVETTSADPVSHPTNVALYQIRDNGQQRRQHQNRGHAGITQSNPIGNFAPPVQALPAFAEPWPEACV